MRYEPPKPFRKRIRTTLALNLPPDIHVEFEAHLKKYKLRRATAIAAMVEHCLIAHRDKT